MRLRYWRNWWGMKCALHWCTGDLDVIDGAMCWTCCDCGKVRK